MKIGINALCSENKSGTGIYATKIISEIAHIDRENEYYVFLPESASLLKMLNKAPNFRLHQVPPMSNIKRIFFEQSIIPKIIHNQNIELFHSPAFVIPFSSRVKQVATIHDLAYLFYPQLFPLNRRWYYRYAITRSIKSADILIADSNSTRSDIINTFHVPSEKIKTIHLGVSESYFSPHDLMKTREKYNLPERFIMSCGTLEPRKNFEMIVRAIYRLKNKREIDLNLVLVGRRGWYYKSLFHLIRELKLEQNVVFLDYLPENDLIDIYHLASIFIVLSRHEGFGLPVLEAMAAGTPVIASNTSSFPEIINDAGILVDPFDDPQIEEAITRILDDKSYAYELGQAAVAFAKNFSWRAAAGKMIQAFESLK